MVKDICFRYDAFAIVIRPLSTRLYCCPHDTDSFCGDIGSSGYGYLDLGTAAEGRGASQDIRGLGQYGRANWPNHSIFFAAPTRVSPYRSGPIKGHGRYAFFCVY